MDPKELRNPSLIVNVSDDSTKYVHSSPTQPQNKNKSFNDIGSSSMGKVDATTARPCAIIGPDRVLPHGPAQDLHLKNPPTEPWAFPENAYRQPANYPINVSEYQPTRNISPRQTFQENMQRIMVPPIYSSVKNNDDSNLKNSKLNMPQEAKYCDVPYNMNIVNNDHKSVRNADIPMSSVNPAFSRSVPPYGWPSGVNIRPPRPYGAPEFYQFPEYSNCGGQRAMTMIKPHRTNNEETAQLYSERLYQEANIRFKPYPMPKEKPQQLRYDYINNYSNTFHPPVAIPPLKYDLQKPIHGHPYPVYPQIKYLDRRIHEPFTEGYQRNQNNLNVSFRNQVGPPPYGPIPGNCVQNKPYTDRSSKHMTVNKHLQFDSNNKIYLDLEPNHNKGYPMPENMYYNEMNHIRGEMILPNHSTLNMHTLPQHQIYRRDNPHLKSYEYNVHYRNVDQSINLNYSLPRLPLQFSPNAIAISPSDSNTSIDTTHTVSTSQEDCGYVSQSSTASVRSSDMNSTMLQNNYYRRRDCHGIATNSLHGNDVISQNHKNKESSTNNRNLNVRQFLQMWNESEDETNESTKEIITQIKPNNLPAQSQLTNNQEQLYVLGLVDVPSEELSKYEHIQKISKLPENIKGYNSIELLNQYEKLVESSHLSRNSYTPKQTISKDNNFMSKTKLDKLSPMITRPVSPLDVEAKISQSVIHKEVGCNFEIKPCSPEMLNVEIATPVQTILGERIIEKIENHTISKSPLRSISTENKTQFFSNKAINNPINLTNCNINNNNQYSPSDYPNLTRPTNYNVQEYDTNSGICLTSLPRLDNDIELNFPEINQQFITDNKIESDIVAPAKDLPRLDLEHFNPASETISFQQQDLLSPQTRLSPNVEKESSKLSKYRKNKKCEVNSKEENLKTRELIVPVHQRIDSVIIKNPDNTKFQEDNISLSAANVVEEQLNNHQSETEEKSLHSPINQNNNDVCNISFETAIDFSLGKNDEGKSDDNICVNDIDKNHLETNCNKLYGLNDNIENKMNSILIESKDISPSSIVKQGAHKELLENTTFLVNDDILTKTSFNEAMEESNVPVIKELASELKHSGMEEHIESTQNDITVIHENEITHLDFAITESHEQKQDLDSANKENELDGAHKESVELLQQEKIIVHHAETTTACQIEHDFLLGNNLSYESANKIDSEIFKEEINISHGRENIKDDIIENVFKQDIEMNPIINNNVLPRETSDLNEAQVQPGTLVDNNEIACINNINFEVNKTLLLQNELGDIKKKSTLDNNDGPNSKKLFQTLENPVQENSNISISQHFEANDISKENFFKSNDNISDNEDDIEENANDKTNCMTDVENTIQKYTDENKHSNEAFFLNNPIKDSDIKVKDKCSEENSLMHKENSPVFDKNTPVPHIFKELYSPWIQKLFIFKEGYCNNLKTETVKNDITCDLPGSRKKEVFVEHHDKDLTETPRTDSEILDLKDKNRNDKEYNSTLNELNNDSLLLDINKKDFVDIFNDNDCSTVNRRKALKRSLSESALQTYKENEDMNSTASSKRRKADHNIIESHITSEEFCNIIQSNRRNSVSTFYNEDNLYIVINNDLIITEETEENSKIYFSEMTEDCNNLQNESIDAIDELTTSKEIECAYSNSIYSVEKSVEESWVEDVACIETVVSEDITEDIEFSEESPKRYNFSNEFASDESLIYSDSEHIDKIKNIYGTTMCNDIQLLETLYRTPQMDVYRTLDGIESRNSDEDEQCSEDIELEKNIAQDRHYVAIKSDANIPSYNSEIDEKENIAENIEFNNVPIQQNNFPVIIENNDSNMFPNENKEEQEKYIINSCESINENIMTNTQKDNSNYSYSSSPEVSSTTSEEKGTGILLKITNYNGSRMSQINEINAESINKLSYKLTEKKEYRNYNSNFRSSRTLITKAAQKYIPPLKETIRDLKVKLPLPEHRLNSLKQLKTSKVEPKIDDIILKHNDPKQRIPKKPKPKFEDVLKSIDEIQFKKHKDKIKKTKNGIPKVIIKKNENGAHYASSDALNDTEAYNPDLTGRKWQPWVFLEKNFFIDRMAIKNKVRAVYCHRKNTYVLAEKLKKYKSMYNANFVISQPNSANSSKGNLKYTIKLKHI